MEWDQDKTLLFIEKYKEMTILWDPSHPQHYNKIKKQDAWVDLASLLETEVETCKKKITSLLASLRREKQKIKKSTGTGKGQCLLNTNYQSLETNIKRQLFKN